MGQGMSPVGRIRIARWLNTVAALDERADPVAGEARIEAVNCPTRSLYCILADAQQVHTSRDIEDPG